MFNWLKRLALAGVVALVAACGGGHEDPTIAQTVGADSRFSILSAAVAAADLGPALADPNARLTVFAPFGLEDLFSLRLRPNPARSIPSFRDKVSGIIARWPEVRIEA